MSVGCRTSIYCRTGNAASPSLVPRPRPPLRAGSGDERAGSGDETRASCVSGSTVYTRPTPNAHAAMSERPKLAALVSALDSLKWSEVMRPPLRAGSGDETTL